MAKKSVEEKKLGTLLRSKRSNKEVASILGVTPRTVQRYRAVGTNPKTGRPKQTRTPSKKIVARTPAKLPRKAHAPYKGKLKAKAANARKKKNTTTKIEGKRAIKSKAANGETARVRMHATYDFYGNDRRTRAITFELTLSEAREFADIESIQEAANFLISTRGANFIDDECKVYGVQEIKAV